MIKDALDRKRDALQSKMLDFLKEKASDFQRHELMDDKMILNCALLLDKDKEKEFDQALNAVSESLALVSNVKSSSPSAEAQFCEERLKHMQEFFNTLDRIAQAVLALDSFRLSSLAKLGLGKPKL